MNGKFVTTLTTGPKLWKQVWR